MIIGPAYGPVGPRDFSFNSDFDYRNLFMRIEEYNKSSNKNEKWYWQIYHDIATSHCFRDLRILLINQLDKNE